MRTWQCLSTVRKLPWFATPVTCQRSDSPWQCHGNPWSAFSRRGRLCHKSPKQIARSNVQGTLFDSAMALPGCCVIGFHGSASVMPMPGVMALPSNYLAVSVHTLCRRCKITPMHCYGPDRRGAAMTPPNNIDLPMSLPYRIMGFQVPSTCTDVDVVCLSRLAAKQ